MTYSNSRFETPPSCRRLLLVCLCHALLFLTATTAIVSRHKLCAQTPLPQQQFQAAVTAQQSGNSLRAIQLYKNLLRSHPDALPAISNLAGLLIDSGDFGEAIAVYRAGLAVSPSTKDLHLGLAYALGRRGQPEDFRLASAELNPLHQHEPQDEQVTMLLADAYTRQGRFIDALPLLTALETAHPQDRDVAWLTGTALIRTGHLPEGLQRIDAIAAAGGAPEAYLVAGEARLGLQQFDQAKSDAEAALKQQPNLPGALTMLGRALEHLGEYSAAEAVLRKALANDLNDFQAQFYLGAILLFKRDLPQAEEHLRLALTLQPDSAEVRYKIALIEQSNGNREAAVEDLKKVVALRAQWMEPRAKLIALLYGMGRGDEAAQIRASLDKLSPNTSPQPTLAPQP